MIDETVERRDLFSLNFFIVDIFLDYFQFFGNFFFISSFSSIHP